MTMSEFDKLAENYSRCYGKNQLRFGSKPVLIVIDCVKAYHDPTSPLYAPERFDEALKSILRLIEKCRAVGIPVVYTSVIYETPQSGGKCDCTILCGYSTSGCVRATALDSMQYGYSPFVVKDACGDRHASVNDSNLFDMQAKFAEVLPEQEMMKLIDGIKKQ
ncbi:putative N-carbamoylsarcosine amidase [Hyaloscypha sp. PMI_1271]|nr:putative N-carbamoylsarcosine amidase [Hyaloscypha sp. PMI_1271]